MILANITFGTRRNSAPAQLEDLAECYLGTLYRSGQLCGKGVSTDGGRHARIGEFGGKR